MATTSMVFLKTGDSYEGIYCHFDGGIEDGVGEILFYNYTDRETIRNLIDLGDASSLGETLNECVFYERDKDEDFHAYDFAEEDLEAVIESMEPSYVYIFDEDWKYAEIDGSGNIEWNDLSDMF